MQPFAMSPYGTSSTDRAVIESCTMLNAVVEERCSARARSVDSNVSHL